MRLRRAEDQRDQRRERECHADARAPGRGRVECRRGQDCGELRKTMPGANGPAADLPILPINAQYSKRTPGSHLHCRQPTRKCMHANGAERAWLAEFGATHLHRWDATDSLRSDVRHRAARSADAVTPAPRRRRSAASRGRAPASTAARSTAATARGQQRRRVGEHAGHARIAALHRDVPQIERRAHRAQPQCARI